MIAKLIAVGVGAAGGAWIRWCLGLALNSIVKNFPLGTFVANLIGGFFIGIAVEFFSQNAELTPEWKLLIVTGFLGGLTTFSTFSAESVQLLQSARYGWMAFHIGAHTAGSIAMTVLGIYLCKAMLS